MSWTERNLAVQGYCLSSRESRALRRGLRFPTALCLALVITGLALKSADGEAPRRETASPQPG
jgi:hypothetical protein